ncbi:MAG: phosphatidate cytidylyltransferase [Treponema sp.]|jgi:phosphatidate cytidylyltransferase|nr:phosphatidate cytidylyltransferase [Treponema sp.]
MKEAIKRLLTFSIAIPAIIALILFLPFMRHLPLNIVVILFSAVGGVEFSKMLEKKNLHITKIEAFILGALAPAALTLNISFNCPSWTFPLLLMAGCSWTLLSHIFYRSEKMETVTNYIAAGFSVMAYPGFFMYWLIKMNYLENSGPLILIFLMIILGTDAAAWLFGNLFGAKNRGIIPASPNKSIAGFAGGIFGSIVVSGGAVLIVPAIFTSRFGSVPALCTAIVLGICTGIAGALGDLAESAIKRSCGVKDSGKLMPGRGGVMDSIDSIATASPVFFLLFNVFFINS